ncbi:leucine-rich repeat-containing protein 26 [Microcaecilia unicolor]|uniref:Leucine-rich repeat-containing protein 26 n=1 Tax=Microcaecilia unicolor TaxID=1415580 RepID=A0A6P7YBM5_9AMPH|nr:leucine-rich repeat-containing protein 26 [Microcaecilia unicolor]
MDRGKAITSFLALLIVLRCFSSFACPEICMCDSGTVDCKSKDLSSVPVDVPRNSTSLLLGYNRITVLRESTFLKQLQLQHLELQNNDIFYIHPKAFQSLHNLSHLDLSSNHLVSLSEEMFNPVRTLTFLNLGNNGITNLSPRALQRVLKLQFLFLHNNALSDLSVGILNDLPSLKHLRLDGNPWTCNCQIEPLYIWINGNIDKIQEKDLIQCAFPESLDRYPVISLVKDSFGDCRQHFVVIEYLYVLLIGLSLFTCSLVICLISGSMVVSYQRMLHKVKTRAHIYKKKPTTAEKQTTVGHQNPVCTMELD